MKKWLGLLAMAPIQGMIFMDQTILPVALPTIQKEFFASDLTLEWSVNVYLLFTAMFSLFGGKIGDKIGHRLALFIGIILFTFASTLCAMSPNIETLICGRALQGLAAALILPLTTILFTALFPENKRGRAIGMTTSVSSLFLIAGPLVGGYLTQEISWRWIFWINPFLCLLGLIFGKLFLPQSPPSEKKHIDLPGLFSFTLFAGSTILFLTQSRIWGWNSSTALGWICLALASLALLLYREKTAKHPFLDLSLFKHKAFSAINVSIGFIQFLLMISVFRAIYLQETLGYTPTETGLLTFVSTAPVLIGSPIGGYIADKITPKLPIAIGHLFLILSFFWLWLDPLPSLSVLLITFFLFGAGITLVFTPSYSTAMKSVPPNKTGTAFGILATLRGFAGTLGIALIGLTFSLIERHTLLQTGNQREADIASFTISHGILGCLAILSLSLSFLLYRNPPKPFEHPFPGEGWD